MFCPQCGHQQSSKVVRFCARCGFLLDLVAGMLADSDRRLHHERQEVTGVSWLTATLLLSFNFILVFGLVTLPHLVNPIYLIIWLLFLVTSLTTGGIGLAKLMRSGYLSRLKERELRLEIAAIEQKRLA